MYTITCGDTLLSICDSPRYVKKKEDTGAYVGAGFQDAQAVSIDGTLYNILGKRKYIEDAETVLIQQSDTSEFIFETRVAVEKNKNDSDSSIIKIEDAVCELDAVTDERINSIETALCELDELISKGDNAV